MRTTFRARTIWLCGLAALLVALTFSACGAHAPQSNSVPTYDSSGQTAEQTTQSSSDVQSTDQSVQDAMQSLNAAQFDANQDYSSQDTPTQP